jgi:tetratricopeptide (TPR) repeat protein
MHEIFNRILDRLKGANFWIALGFLAAGYFFWRLIGTTGVPAKTVLLHQITAELAIALLGGGAIWVNYFFFLRERPFPENRTGILVMRIAGDDAKDSLRNNLVRKLHAKLQNETFGERVEVHASDKTVDENKGLASAHERARAVGHRLNAKLVIWGGKSDESKFYPRITVIAVLKDWSAVQERTHDLTEVDLPEELWEEPFYLIHFAAGYSYYIQKNYKDALPLFQAALVRKGALTKELADLQFCTAVCQHSLASSQEPMAANLQEARRLLEEAAKVYKVKDQGKFATTQYNLGTLYSELTEDRSANLLKAIAAFDEAIRLNPKDADAYINRGSAHASIGNCDTALADYDEAIRLDPKLVVAYYNRGNVYIVKRDYDKAIAEYDEAIRLNPKFAPAYHNRGAAHGIKGDYDRAFADKEEVRRLDPKLALAAFEQVSQLDPRDSFAYHDAAIQLNPKDPLAYYNRGNAFIVKGDYDHAIADYDEAIRLDPKLANAYYNRGNAYMVKRDYDKAVADKGQAIRLDPRLAFAPFDEAIRLNPKDWLAFYERGIVYQMRGDFDEAVADYNEAIRHNPEFADAYNALAWLLATCMQTSCRDGEGAVHNATQACKLTQWKDPKSLDTLAAAYAEAGEFEAAIKCENKCLQVPNLSEKIIADAKIRLVLYQNHQPYREGS